MGGIRFILMVNKQGQTRLAKYYDFKPIAARVALEADLIRACLARGEAECSLLEHKRYRAIYRRYASLYFIVGIDYNSSENELALLELIHALVETLDKYFENVCELDIMFNIEKAHMVIDEMISCGCIVDTNKADALAPLHLVRAAVAQAAASGSSARDFAAALIGRS